MTARKRSARLTVADVCADLQVTEKEWEQWRKRGDTPLHIARTDGTLEVRETDYERWIDSRTIDLPPLGDGA